MSLLRRILRQSQDNDSSRLTPLDSSGLRGVLRPSSSAIPVQEASDQVLCDADAEIATGRLGEALAKVSLARAANPGDMRSLYWRGKILFCWGRVREALSEFLKAEAGGLRDEDLYLHLGWSNYALGHLDSAADAMRRACAASPESATAYFNLAVTLRAQRQLDEAVASHLAALVRQPDALESLIGLGGCYLDQGNAERAQTCFRKALSTHGDRASIWEHLGVALGQLERDDDALVAFETAARLEGEGGDDVDGFINLAINHRDAGRIEEALQIFEKHLPQRPSLEGHYAYSHTLLIGGYLRDGWKVAEFRWSREPLLSKRPHFERPVWSGQDLRGKTILLRAEQGLGDTIQFIRYAPQLKPLGATVLLRAPDSLGVLARSFPGVDRVLGPTDTPDFDYYIHLLSLPRAFDSDTRSIPREIPYIRADAGRLSAWAGRIPDDELINVGLVWAGSPEHQRDRFRSIEFPMLGSLAAITGVRWYSLQKGPKAAQARDTSAELATVDLEKDLVDLSDAAAAIARLDLVICVDTAIGHLAGAMGKPVWMLLPQPPDWRWMEQGNTSPWYPTMTLYRQGKRGDWTEVVDAVAVALRRWVANGGQPEAANSIDGNQANKSSDNNSSIPKPESRLPEGLSGIAEIRYGILQYFPRQPLIGDSIRLYGEYLQTQLDFLSRLIHPGATVMEVGVGIGAHALRLSALVGANGHLFLYEADPLLKRILRQNLSINRIGNATLMKRYLADPARIAATSADGPNTDRLNFETIDELQLEALDWLKINLDADAANVLAGATDSVWRLRPKMFITVQDETDVPDVGAQLRELSYRIWRLESTLFSPTNFNHRDDNVFGDRKIIALLAVPEEIDIAVELPGCVEVA